MSYASIPMTRRGYDVRRFVRNLENWIMAALAEFGVKSEVRDGRVGVWVTQPDGREEKIAAIGCDAVGLDWTCDIGEARKRVGGKIALQGNMDPAVLRANPARIREEVATILADFGANNGHVFNLGHGITPDIGPDHAAAFIDAVHELSVNYHGPI